MKVCRVRASLGFLAVPLVGLLGATLAAQETESDWPQFRGPGGAGVSAAKGLPTTWSGRENVLWKAALPGAGTSSPIVVGGKIFLTCYSGYGEPGRPRNAMSALKRHVACLDAQSGKLLWDRPVPSKLPEQETIRENHGYASSTPAADGQRVYAFFGKAGVFAFDHQGKQLWQADVGDRLNGWGSGASLTLHKELVIVNASVESESLVALDRKSGQEVWRARGIRESWAMPTVVTVPGGKAELVVPILGKILGFDPDSGQQLWSCATNIAWYMVPTLTAHDGIVYCIGGRSGGALAVRAGGRGDVTRTHRLWTGNKGSNVSSPVYHDGHLYWAHEGLGVVYCADAKTGRLVYEERLGRGGPIYASALLAGGKLYYLDRLGRTFVVAVGPRYELLALNDLGVRGMYNASLAVANGRLFLRSEQTLYCLGKQ